MAMCDVNFMSEALELWIENAIESNDLNSINKIRQLWNNESWDSIVKKYKYLTDGSVWFVWWMDGIMSLEKKYYMLGTP